MNSLDLFSTSQTSNLVQTCATRKRDKAIYDECLNNAPFFAYQIEGKKYGIVQGCCNDWNCPRCGQQRAREEYGRIVAGAREIAETHKLYFFTVTCRGSDCTIEEAENEYIVWTNRLLTRLRTEAKRSNKAWFYASVTERQTRLHPHSHFVTTYCPDDAVLVQKGEQKHFCTSGEQFVAQHATLQSYRLEQACVDCGLGRQYDISEVESVEAGSRYMAKYLFKESIFTTKWPKGWRRVRYSQNWPKLPDVKGEAFVLIKKTDWWRLSRLAVTVVTKDDYAKQRAKVELNHSDVIIQ